MPGRIKIRFAHTQGNGILHLIYNIKEFADTGGLNRSNLI